MSSLFQHILGLLLMYKYITLFFVAFLSSLGIPLPASSSTMASAAFASQGYLNIFVVILVGVLANLLGDVSMYSLSKKYGKKILSWLHLRKLSESETIKNIEKIEKNYSALMIIASRFQDQATTIVNFIAGVERMELKRFLLYALIGDLLQTLFYSSIGYFFAANWQAIYSVVGVFSWLIILCSIIISILLANKITKRMLK